MIIFFLNIIPYENCVPKFQKAWIFLYDTRLLSTERFTLTETEQSKGKISTFGSGLWKFKTGLKSAKTGLKSAKTGFKSAKTDA